MDVIAGRKTSGKITGQILINGHPQAFPSFNRLMGYCEQVRQPRHRIHDNMSSHEDQESARVGLTCVSLFGFLLSLLCVQTDTHIAMHTVREAVDFSAKLRLPSEVSAEERRGFVDQILEDLELTSLAGRLVGDANVEGLSPGELKRLTIGVELAANPTFLFLDEPTSGLDSRAALIVLRVIHKIARRGRAVVCTIHQPSAEVSSGSSTLHAQRGS